MLVFGQYENANHIGIRIQSQKYYFVTAAKGSDMWKEFHAGPSLQETVTYQLGMQSLLDRSPHDGDGGAVMVMMIISYLFLLLYILVLKTHFCVIIKPI